MSTVIQASAWRGAAGTMEALLSGIPTKAVTAAVPIVFWGHTVIEDIHPLIALGIMYALDLILGLIRAFKHCEFNSRMLYRTGGKLFVYCILAIIATQAALAVDYLFFMPGVVYGYIALTELASVIENLNDLGYRVPILNIVYKFLALKKIDNRRKSGTLSQLLVDEMFSEDEIEAAMKDLEKRKRVIQTQSIEALRKTTRLKKETAEVS